MRRSARTRHRTRGQTGGISLFPFLAVLICTMGSLIILLVVIARQAQLQAAETADADAAEVETEIQTELERTQWRTEAIRSSLDATREQLAEARLALGHLEDHARRLSNQLAELQADYRQLERGADGQEREALRRELNRVQAELAEARRRLAEARQSAANQPATYAVVPYEGPFETRRRPVYVECRADAVVLQPEGIVLEKGDFAAPLGPGNPLAVALRAAREHLQRSGGLDPAEAGEPYPLLLVRPEGIAAYYAAREAIESWASEFGYEMIGEDWQIEYRPPDAELGQAMQTAVNAARVARQRSAATTSDRGADSEPTWYRAAPVRGGTVATDGGGMPVPGGASRDGGWGGDNGRGTTPPDDRRSRQPDASSEAPFGRSGGRQDLRTAAAGEAATGIANPIRQPDPGRPGEGRPGEPRPGEWTPGGGSAAEVPPSASADGARSESLARQRGRDWGLPDATRGSVPISRPIRIECHGNRLVLVPEAGAERFRTVILRPRTEDSIDELVSAVWEHVESWGVAGSNMYWRPVLNIEVAPDAGGRFEEIDALLQGSGLRVQRL